jgi:excisionase family DNA binding protein
VARLLDFAGACQYTGWSERFLRRLVFERRVAFYKDRRKIFFAPADLDRFIDGLRVEARRVPLRAVARGGGP